jgi:hypothetical protein
LGKKLAFLLQNFDFSGQKLVDEEQLLFFLISIFFHQFSKFQLLTQGWINQKSKTKVDELDDPL